jgi:hypothetical protein
LEIPLPPVRFGRRLLCEDAYMFHSVLPFAKGVATSIVSAIWLGGFTPAFAALYEVRMSVGDNQVALRFHTRYDTSRLLVR